MSTKLVKSYLIPKGKNIDGIARSVKDLFCTYSNSEVSSNVYKDGSWIIKCIPKPMLKRDYILNIDKVIGTEYDIEVTIKQKGDYVKVHYVQNINEFERVVKSFFQFAPVGIANLYGVRKRHKIPGEIDKAISAYLDLYK